MSAIVTAFLCLLFVINLILVSESGYRITRTDARVDVVGSGACDSLDEIAYYLVPTNKAACIKFKRRDWHLHEIWKPDAVRIRQRAAGRLYECAFDFVKLCQLTVDVCFLIQTEDFDSRVCRSIPQSKYL